MISKRKTIASLLLFVMVSLTSIASFANINERMTSIKESKKKLNQLVKEANRYYLDSIDALEKRQDAIKENVPEYQQEDISVDRLKAEFQRLERDTATKNETLRELYETILAAQSDQELENAVDEFVVSLYDSQCNPSAIASLDKFDTFLNKDYIKKTFKKDREVLNKYQKYAEDMAACLDSVYRDLNRDGWIKQEEGSDILKIFDKTWKHVEYLKHTGKKGEKIKFLDDIVLRIQDMRTLGFEDQKEEFKDIRELLKTKDQPIATPIDNLLAKKDQYDKLKEDIANDLERMKQIDNEIDRAAQTNNDVNEFESLNYILDNNYDHWYGLRKVIDTEILNYCALCLSEPADSVGDNYRFRELVKKELMGFAQSDVTKIKIETYKVLFDNYWNYTLEIRKYLKDYSKLRGAQGGNTSQKGPAEKALHQLSYWNYYSHRKDENAVSIPHLDKILDQYMKWFISNFSGVTKEAYGKLGHELMGTQSSNAAKPSPISISTEDEQTEKLLNELGNSVNNSDISDEEESEKEDAEVKKAQEKAEKEAKKAQEKAEKEAKKAQKKAEKELKEAQEKADKEVQEAIERAEEEAQKTQEHAEREAQERAEKEAQKTQEKAEKDAQKAQEKADKEAQKAQEKANKDALKAQEKANKDALKAQEKAEKEAKKAQEKAEKEAQKAQEEAEKARKLAEKAEKEAEEARKKAEKAKQKAENDDTEESDEGTK
ncbi:MAG: hypothetical protein IKX31_03175 [Muribaculaceae bacterium]|nr:hypothetical protein [Muribaculaceae bacterium]